ncbi:MAG: hypothetical protein WD898_03945 [Candidatus Paceibacterota bacterium]
MRVHSSEKIEQLKRLRRAGHSIEDLVRMLSIPKTTVWHHIQGIKLRKEYILRLKANQGGSKLKKERDLAKAKENARTLLNSKHRRLVELLAMLYWAEGDNKNAFSFTNTNSEMISMFIIILEKCFNISRDQLLVTVRYFTGMSRDSCLKHWSVVTKVPKKQINMYYNDGGKRGRTEFGICRIGVRKSGYLFKVIRSLIAEIPEEINCPRS